MENVCGTCGDEGSVEALIYCDSCKSGAVHRYCCGITPVPIDGYVTWFCSDCDESDTASDSIQVELQDTCNVDVSSSSPPIIQTMEEPETREIAGSCSKSDEASVSEAGDGAFVLEISENEKKKKKKKKRKISTHSLPDATIVEAMEETKKQDGSENGKSDELNGLVRNETSVLDKSGKKKKKKKTYKGEEKKNGQSSNHFSPVLEAEGHGLQATTSVEPMKESKKRKFSGSREFEELNVVFEEKEIKTKKKKKNQESCTLTLPVLEAEGHVLQDVTSVEAMKESTMPKCSENRESEKCVHRDTTNAEAIKKSKKHRTSDSRESDELVRNEISVLEESEKKKKTNEERSNHHTAPVLAGKNSVVYGTSNVELTKAQEISASRKPDDLAGLEENGASVSEGGNSTNVPDHDSCTTRKKRSLSSRKIHVTSEIMELPANNSSCKEAESNMHQTNEVILALNKKRAQPIRVLTWRIETKMGVSLPSRLALPGLKYPIGSEPKERLAINQHSASAHIKIVESVLTREEMSRVRGSFMGPVIRLSDMKISLSAKIVYSILTKSIVTNKDNEAWFHFGAQPMRFSIREYHMVTGLKCGGEVSQGGNERFKWDFLKGRVHTLKDVERQLRNAREDASDERFCLAMLLLIESILLPKSRTGSFPLDYVKKAQDMDVLMTYPWGREGYILLLKSIKKAVDNHLENTTKFELQGFPLVFLLWILESIPLLQERFSTVIPTPLVQQYGPIYLCEKYIEVESPQLDRVLQFEVDERLKVICILPSIPHDPEDDVSLEDKHSDELQNVVDISKKGYKFKADDWRNKSVDTFETLDALVQLVRNNVETGQASVSNEEEESINTKLNRMVEVMEKNTKSMKDRMSFLERENMELKARVSELEGN